MDTRCPLSLSVTPLLRGKRQGENKKEKASWEMIRQFNKGKTKVEIVKAKENKRFCSLLSINRQCLVTSQELGFQHVQWLLWKTSSIIKNALPTPLFPTSAFSFLLIAGQMTHCLWSVGVSSWLCPLSRLCPPSAQRERLLERAQMLCWSLLVLTW